MDFLSFSPSLVSIFSLLKRRDISQCRLVNRRFVTTINGHHRLAPRKKVTVFIKRVQNKHDHTSHIVITGRAMRPEYQIAYFRHLKDFDFSFRIDNQSITVPSGRNHELFKYIYKETMAGLDIESLFEGLHIVLSPLFQKCNVVILNLTDSSPKSNDQWQQIVASIFKMHHTDCDSFRPTLWNTFNRIFTNYGKLQLIRPGASKNTNFSELPASLPREQVVCTVRSRTKTLEMMADLLKGWYEGHHRLLRLRLYLDDYTKKQKRRLHLSIVDDFGPECEWRSFYTRKDDLRETFIRRPHDDMVLCLAQINSEYGFYLYDFKHSGPLKEIHFYLGQYC